MVSVINYTRKYIQQNLWHKKLKLLLIGILPVVFKKLQENKLVLGILVKNGVFNYHLNSEN